MLQPDAPTVANNVRLRRSQFSGAFIITEGYVDAQVYRQQTDPAAVQIIVGFGKSNVIEALELLRASGVEGVLGAVDADFARLRREPTGEPVITDDHDVEMMLFRSPAFDKTLDALGSSAKAAAYAAANGGVREGILNAAAPIGALRLVSLDNGLNLDFDGLRYRRVLDSHLRVQIPELVRVVLQNSRSSGLAPAELIDATEKVLAQGHDPYQLCCGHDVLALFGIGLRSQLGSAAQIDVQEERLARSLVLAYERSHFQLTKVYERLRQWERDNVPYRLLP